jgi:membrane protease YdiL (CAAX protease family)
MAALKLTPGKQTTIADSWRWLWPDVLMRILPLSIIPFIYIALFHLPLPAIGLTLHDVPLQLMVGLLVGVLMAAFSAFYRMYIVGGWFRRPTRNDQLFQSIYYLFLNAPVEELFFRGFILEAVSYWTGWLGWGVLASMASYTLYHRLGNWNWRSVGGVGLASVVFTLVYLGMPGSHSLLAVTIVHGFATSGFLSWGSEMMHHFWKRQMQTANEQQVQNILAAPPSAD